MSNVREVHGVPKQSRPPIGEEGRLKALELRRLFVTIRIDDMRFMSSYGDAVKFCIDIVYGIASNLLKVYKLTGSNDIVDILNDALEDYMESVECTQ